MWSVSVSDTMAEHREALEKLYKGMDDQRDKEFIEKLFGLLKHERKGKFVEHYLVIKIAKNFVEFQEKFKYE